MQYQQSFRTRSQLKREKQQKENTRKTKRQLIDDAVQTNNEM